jgi:hypothetical protein
MQTQCLVEGDAATRLTVGVRFLHVVWRQAVDPAGLPVDAIAGHLTWEEATEREARLGPVSLGGLAGGRELPVAVAAGCEEERMGDAGALVRTWEALQGRVCAGAEPAADGVLRVTVRIENTTPWPGGPREAALRRTLCSTHTVLRAQGGSFVSLTDPPPALRAAAEGCRNVGTWPVLAGEAGARDTLLSSPIILSDHPRIAPESPGDLFDGGEIDQLLVLNILSLTDAEKAEMRASDPRAREILDRTEALSPDDLMSLHGAIREWQVRAS